MAFGGKLGGEVRGGGGDGQGDSYHRRRVLAWLKSRLPMAWILNEALLGRVSGIPLGTVRREGNNDESERTAARGAEIGIERTLAISLVSRAYGPTSGAGMNMVSGGSCPKVRLCNGFSCADLRKL